MKTLDYYITTIDGYPDNGKHLQCNVLEPFCIRKGEDGYTYLAKNGSKKNYNLGNQISEMWICNLKDNSSVSLEKIFEIKTSKSLVKILEYCLKTYLKSLNMEIKRITKTKKL